METKKKQKYDRNFFYTLRHFATLHGDNREMEVNVIEVHFMYLLSCILYNV